MGKPADGLWTGIPSALAWTSSVRKPNVSGLEMEKMKDTPVRISTLQETMTVGH